MPSGLSELVEDGPHARSVPGRSLLGRLGETGLLALTALAIFSSGCACRGPELEPTPRDVRVEPRQLDFGRVIVGQVDTRTLEVINSGGAPLEATFGLTGEAFSTDDGTPTRVAVGSTFLTVRCAPPSAGPWDGKVTVSFPGFSALEVPLACEGVPVPECVPSGSCREARWDDVLGRCVEVSAADGTACGASDVCVVAATCRGGRCTGAARTCADADPCTIDSCHPTRGCEHLPTVTCPNQSACRVGRCRAGVGCELIDVEDGTPCGPTRTCALADVCISGQCVQRRPPEGFACVPQGPCGGAGRCVNDVCEQTSVDTVQPRWTFGGLPDGGPPEAWSDVFSDRDGGLVLSSYFMSPPRLRADSAQPVDLSQTARRCIEWLGWIVCGDLPALQAAPVTAVDPGTGQQVWSFTGAAQLIPEFVGPTVQYFTARLAVMSENELLALYESRTLTAAGADPRCRTFGLVVLDRQGQALRSRFLDDPLFEVCDHPHSYGVAVDAQGNLYLAFTPSGADNPATTLVGTTLFSYTPALQLRWRRFLPSVAGGELAVADGRLFLEKSDEVRSSATGDPLGPPVSGRFGLGVAGQGLFVVNRPGAARLEAHATADGLPRWQRALGGTLGRSPLSVATWQSPWGPRDVVLSFSSTGSGLLLEGTELLTGASAFACPVALPDLPTLGTVTPGGVGVMIGTQPAAPGWPLCEDCDPRYARTRSRFAWLPLPGVGPSRASWAGTWGNDGHSHRENR